MKEILASIVLFALIFSVVFEITAFDKQLQKKLIERNSQRENKVNENEKVLDFFRTNQLELNMTAEETAHMQDVKQLNNYFKLFIWLLVIVFGMLVYFSRSIISVVENLWIPLTASAVLSLSFVFFPEQIFSLFHKIFFPQGNYLFDSNSFLITLYPQNYFFELFYSILLRAFFAVIMLILASIVCKRIIKK